MNQLFYGDNLHVIRDRARFPDACIDLVYLDPPFNSKRDYNLLFKSPKGQRSDAQITAFKDSWHWGEQAEREFDEVLHQPNTAVAEMMRALRAFLRENDMMAYLTMMANRLLELHRVLKPTGSLYLHCDPTASHYLRILLDAVFGKEMFLNEIIWKRSSSHGDTKQGMRRCGKIHDTLLLYAKTNAYVWNPVYTTQDEGYVEMMYKFVDEDGRRYREGDLTAARPGGDVSYEWRVKRPVNTSERWAADVENEYLTPRDGWEYLGVPPYNGRFWAYSRDNLVKMWRAGQIIHRSTGFPQFKRYLDENLGVPLQDIWTDINPLSGNEQERLGYPTQKPLGLLQRIVAASSNEGGVVLDPFCGCGTAVHAAQKLNRSWIGIDITHLAISLIEKRLKDAFGATCKFEVQGTPKDLDAAVDLAARDKYQFQWWAVSLVDAQPFQGKKKGADGGIDGLKFFYDVDSKEAQKIVVSVKGGNLKADDVRALNHVREREKAEIALLISLKEPSSGMRADAAAAGLYPSASGKKYPRIQILTIDGLLSGTQRTEHPDFAPNLNFKKAKPESTESQGTLL